MKPKQGQSTECLRPQVPHYTCLAMYLCPSSILGTVELNEYLLYGGRKNYKRNQASPNRTKGHGKASCGRSAAVSQPLTSNGEKEHGAAHMKCSNSVLALSELHCCRHHVRNDALVKVSPGVSLKI